MAEQSMSMRDAAIAAKDDGAIFQVKGEVTRVNAREKVAFLTVNCDRAGYLNVTCFKSAVEIASEIEGGDSVFVEGKLQSKKRHDDLKDAKGYDVWETVLVCDRADKLTVYKAKRRQSQQHRGADAGPPDDDVPPPGDDDIPF